MALAQCDAKPVVAPAICGSEVRREARDGRAKLRDA